MNKEELEQTIKGLQGNQETAIKLLEENVELKKKTQKLIEYINFLINHYKEQLDTPIDDTYFINDDLRRAYILSIKAYLQVLLDILEGDKNDN